MNNLVKKIKEKIATDKQIKSFTPLSALNAFNANLFDEEAVTRWVLQELHPEGIICPSCKVPVNEERQVTIDNYKQGKRITCSECNEQWTFRTNTFLHGSKLTISEVFLIALLNNIHAQGLTINEIANIVEKTPDTIRSWFDIFEIIESENNR